MIIMKKHDHGDDEADHDDDDADEADHDDIKQEKTRVCRCSSPDKDPLLIRVRSF